MNIDFIDSKHKKTTHNKCLTQEIISEFFYLYALFEKKCFQLFKVKVLLVIYRVYEAL